MRICTHSTAFTFSRLSVNSLIFSLSLSHSPLFQSSSPSSSASFPLPHSPSCLAPFYLLIFFIFFRSQGRLTFIPTPPTHSIFPTFFLDLFFRRITGSQAVVSESPGGGGALVGLTRLTAGHTPTLNAFEVGNSDVFKLQSIVLTQFFVCADVETKGSQTFPDLGPHSFLSTRGPQVFKRGQVINTPWRFKKMLLH
jgi:hypothetical protein